MLQSCGPIGPLVSLVAFSGDEEILDETRCSRAQPQDAFSHARGDHLVPYPTVNYVKSPM